MGLELGEGHFDRVEIGAVGRQEQEPGAAFLEDGLGLLAFMAGKVVEDDYIAWLERRGELGFHIGLEDIPVHRSIDDPRRRKTVAPQGGDKGLSTPMPERGSRFEPLPSASPAAQARHLRGCPRLIDEDKAMWLLAHPRLPMPSPNLAVTRYLSAIGFACQQCFF